MAEPVVQSWPASLESTLEKLSGEHPGLRFRLHTFRGETTLLFEREDLHEGLKALRGEGFDYLVDVSSAHYPERSEIDLVYLIRSVSDRRQVRLKTSLPESDPRTVTACDLWPGADWPEREVYDLMGVVFEGHPDLRRILMPEDFEGFPLRKDYPVEGDDSWRNFLRPGEGG